MDYEILKKETMKHSNTELIVERYYRLKYYLVEKDVPILPPSPEKQHWSDLDILAVGEDVLLISCKDYLPGGKDIEKVITNLDNSEKYIKKEYKHLRGKDFKKIYVYGGGTGKDTLSVLKKKDKNIEAIELKNIFAMYLQKLDEDLSKMNDGRRDIPKGKRYTIIGEQEGLDKFCSFLLNNNYFNDGAINGLLKNLKLEELSKPK
jgi:hypothetical protein